MRTRDTALSIPDRRPYVRVTCGDAEFTARIPGLDKVAGLSTPLRTAKARTLAALREMQLIGLAVRPRETWPAGLSPEAIAAVEAVDLSTADVRAEELAGELETAQAALASAAGYVILRTWADPGMELETRTAVDACAAEKRVYASDSDPDPRRAMGLDAYNELIDAGWTGGQIERLALRVDELMVSWLSDPGITEEVKRKAKDFRGTDGPSPNQT